MFSRVIASKERQKKTEWAPYSFSSFFGFHSSKYKVGLLTRDQCILFFHLISSTQDLLFSAIWWDRDPKAPPIFMEEFRKRCLELSFGSMYFVEIFGELLEAGLVNKIGLHNILVYLLSIYHYFETGLVTV